MENITIILGALFLLIIVIRTKVRGYFWKDKKGEELNLKQFLGRWKKGVEGVTPLQQTTTTLWSYPLVIGGLVTGIVIMIIRKEWWLLVILCGSLPMTLMGLLSTYQKYIQQKRIYKIMNKLEKKKNGRKRSDKKRRI